MSKAAFPHLLRVIVDAAGVDAAVRAAKVLGGNRIYIARNPKPNDPLVLAVGPEAAAKIAEDVGGLDIEFPRGQAAIRRHLTAELSNAGLSDNELAGVLKSTYRWARELKKRELAGRPAKVAHRPRRTDERQLDIEAFIKKSRGSTSA